ncbi:NAD-dependent epimerase/dehydratase family protein [Nocardia sp. NPDC004068]|uniref:NAD-dependent epimerase/dehydratase family protein n=1 Tax=Nocardia sp. NPDC004068 TaxID=3364303 RepID=UPI0036B0E831
MVDEQDGASRRLETDSANRARNRLSGARIVVTGGAGFIGSEVTASLLRAGVDVKVVDDLSTGRMSLLGSAFRFGLTDRDVRVVDVRSSECADLIVRWRPDVVVHMAAQASLPAALRAPLVDADINIRGSVNLLQACVQAEVGLVVFAASAAMYGQVPPEQLPVTEAQPLTPSSPYGLSKATVLHYLELFQRHHGLAHVALALANVYGPRRFGSGGGVIPKIATDVVHARRPRITGDGHQTRDFVYVTDVAEAVALACTGEASGLINIASGKETNVLEVVETVGRVAGADIAPVFTPAVPGEARRMVMDIRRAREVLGWQPKVDVGTGITAVVRAVHAAQQGVAV